MDAASSPAVSDRLSARAAGSWMAWTAAGMAGIWVAVTVISLGAPDMVTGSEQQPLTTGQDGAATPGPLAQAGVGDEVRSSRSARSVASWTVRA
ncbi:MAG TPA: hypothetical protein VFQ15_05630, partial [Jiangellaceae bacterium]|nr:hypothetical protein [Jiangellaceae bacterium]